MRAFYALALIACAPSVPNTVTLSVTVSTGGKVTGAGIDCGLDCTEPFGEKGGSDTLTAEANAGYVFRGWMGACSGTDPVCEVSVTENVAVNARFAPTTRKLTVTVTGDGGTINAVQGEIVGCSAVGGTCEGQFPENATVVLEATAASGATFGGWAAPCAGTGPCSVIMTEDKTVAAMFSL